MSIQNLVMQIKSSKQILDNAKAAAGDLLIAMMEDESTPLWDRWNLFMEYSPHCFEIGSDTGCLSDCVISHCHKMFNTDRYQEIWFDSHFDDTFMTDDYRRRSEPESIEKYKEAFKEIPEEVVRSIIYSRYAGFVNDW